MNNAREGRRSQCIEACVPGAGRKAGSATTANTASSAAIAAATRKPFP